MDRKHFLSFLIPPPDCARASNFVSGFKKCPMGMPRSNDLRAYMHAPDGKPGVTGGIRKCRPDG
jgi:hypothetical protein